MTQARYHRRLSILMAVSALLAFAGGAGFEPLPAILAAVGLTLAFFWTPSVRVARVMDRIWVPLALVFVGRALLHVFVIQDDVVIPVVDLLLLLLVAEALRHEDARNEPRIYALGFALLLASTAYRPGLLFGLAFIGFVVLGTMALTVGHMRAQAHRHSGRPVPLGRGLLVGSLAVAAATLIMSTIVFVTFPRVSRGWAGRAAPSVGSMAGFSNEVSLGSHGSRIFPNPEIVLRVEFLGEPPSNPGALYWRGRSYDRFDGQRWSRTRNPPASLATTDWYLNRWGGPLVEYDVFAAPLDNRVLFALHPLLEVHPESAITPIIDNVGDFQYWGSAAPSYGAQSQMGRPHPDSLRAAEEGWVPGRRLYLQLPESLPGRIGTLADSLTADAVTRYDKAVTLERWFHQNFQYTRDLPATAREATLEHFLFNRRAGHCEYYSSAMVVMLRTQGIAAREVNGFLGGKWNEFGQFLAVTQNEAHAWVEVWFPGYGWVPFDPTPAGGVEAAASTAWFWPGRFLFDGMSHRWNKWVLDYSFQDQNGLLDRLAEAVAPSDEPPAPAASDDDGRFLSLLNGPVALAVGLSLALALILLVRRGRRQHLPEATVLYLRTRALFEPPSRAGSVRNRAPGSGPLEWGRDLVAQGVPGGSEALQVAESYAGVRFGSAPWDDATRARMTRAYRAARQARSSAPANA
jgi:transglutaminase-like putative cysteine protease